jgi:hypothetical protein
MKRAAQSLSAKLGKLAALLPGAVLGATLCLLPALGQTNCTNISTLADSGSGSLREALANPNITSICVTATGTMQLLSTLQITHQVTVTGPGSASLTLSGAATDTVPAFQVLQINVQNTPTNPVQVNGLTISGGSATLGGGVHLAAGYAYLFQDSITGNTAQAGGGVYNQGQLTIQNTDVSNNSATNGMGGGVLNVAAATLTLITDSIDYNTSPLNGGGVANSGTMTLSGTTLSENTANGGAGIYNSGQFSTNLIASVFAANTATQAGGAFYNDTGATATLTDAWMDSNTTSGPGSLGGAVYSSGTLSISEATFSANSTPTVGGAIYNVGALTLTDSTLSTNVAEQGAGALYNLTNNSTNSLTLHNDILSGNTTNTSGTPVTDCVGCGTPSSDNLVGVSVSLGRLEYNGGITRTFMPLPGSLAIVGGRYSINGVVIVPDSTDERGLSRVTVNGNTILVDVGAVQTHYSSVTFASQPAGTQTENQPITPVIAVTVAEVDGNTTNYPLGVPVTMLLQTNSTSGMPVLMGGAATYPTSNSFPPTASFPALSVNTGGNYSLLATTYPSTQDGQFPTYSATSSSFTVPTVVAATQTVLSASPASPAYGQTVTLTATVTETGTGAAVQAGSVTFTDNGVPLSPASIPVTTNGLATLSGISLAVGQHSLLAAYGGTATDNASSGPLTVKVVKAAPVVTLVTPPVLLPGAMLSTANVHALATTATGAPLAGTFTYSPALGSIPGAGNQSVTATFTPTDSTDYASTTASASFMVLAPVATATTLTASPNPALPGASVVLSANVASTTPGAIPGTVTFSSPSGTIARPTLSLDPAHASFVAGTAQALTTLNYDYSTYSADFNGDGVADLLLLPAYGSPQLLLSQLPGDPAPAAQTLSLGSTCEYALGLAVGDVNGDGLPDIAAACYNYTPASVTYTLVLLINQGGGNFAPATTVSTLNAGIASVQMVFGDFNGDKLQDLIVLTQCSSTGCAPTLSLLQGDGTGGFTVANTELISGGDTSDYFQNLLAADFNHDGRLDVAFLHFNGSNLANGQVEVWANDGGTPTNPPNFGTLNTNCEPYCGSASLAFTAGTGGTLSSLVSADFNQDRLPDLALLTYANPSGSANTESVALNTSSGGVLGFASINDIATTAPAGSSIVAADFDGDGVPDLVLYDSSLNTATVQHGDKDGTFTANEPNFFITLAPPQPINDDGRHPRTTGRAVLPARTGARAGSRAGGVKPAGSYQNGYAYPQLAVGDTNGDGYPDLLVGQVTVDQSYNYAVNAQPFVANGPGLATSSITAPDTGTTYTAATQPSSAYWTASSGSTPLAVTSVATTTTLSVSPAPTNGSYIYGQTLTFSATVLNNGAPVTAGSVTFTENGQPFATIALSSTGTGTVAAAGIKPGAGSYSFEATYSGAPGETASSATPLPVTILKATPTLTWANPSAITTTTPLSTAQLDATVSGVPTALGNTFTYTPAAGYIFPVAGTYPLNVLFTPSDTANYNTATATVHILVNATATSTSISVSSATSTYGQPLTLTAHVTNLTGSKPVTTGSVTFTVNLVPYGIPVEVRNGMATLAGVTPPAGTPLLTANYDGTSGEIASTAATSVTVSKATPTLTWPTPASISSTTPLSATQLDATAAGVTGAALPGAFVYTPASGTLPVGTQTLSVVFTPTDVIDYTTASASVPIQVVATNTQTSFTVTPAQPVYGQTLTLAAQVVNTTGTTVIQTGSVVFASDSVPLATVPVVNGAASLSGVAIAGGQHLLTASYSGADGEGASAAGARQVSVARAAPTLIWPAPATISSTTPLGATQLNATAAGVTGAALPGVFAYTPAAGSLLSVGTHSLSVTFTPTDATDYAPATAQVSIQVVAETIALSSISPATTTLGTAPLPVTLTGSGFPAGTVVQLNGAAIPTTVLSTTQLGATVPAASLAKAGTLSFTLYDAGSHAVSNAVTLTVTAPIAVAMVTAPATVASGDQPSVALTLANSYPVDLAGTFTLTFTPAGPNGVDDPAVQFSTGGRTLDFTIPAGSTTGPTVSLQSGTVEGTIAVATLLTAGGTNVTPADIATPTAITVAASAPTITGVRFTDVNGLLTIVTTGFSNTREMTSASFIFIGPGAADLSSAGITVPATNLFASWYTSTGSAAFGSTFSYTQTFQLSDTTTNITGVAVTLSNSVGTSASVNSQ